MKLASIVGLVGACFLGFACSSGDQEGGSGSLDLDGDGIPDDGMLGIGEDPNGSGSGSGGRTLEELREAACVGEQAATEPQPAVLELVVDVSGSMGQDAPGSSRSKWAVTRDALREAIDSLPSTTGVGVLFYPNMDTTASEPTGTGSDPPRDLNACVNTGAIIPIDLLGAPGSAHRQAIEGALDRVDPGGGTPTHDAYGFAVDALSATTLPGNRFMLLITDGQPTFLSGCRGTGNIVDAVDPRPIIDEAQSAVDQGARSFVIGSPGSEEVGIPVFSDARTWLSMTASVGQTGPSGCSDDGPNFCHLDMTQEANFSDALRAGLSSIVGQVVSCNYQLPRPPSGEEIDQNRVNVVFWSANDEEQLITQAPPGDCTEGWQYGDGLNSIVLCEETCDRIKRAEEPRVELLFGCVTETGPIR